MAIHSFEQWLSDQGLLPEQNAHARTNGNGHARSVAHTMAYAATAFDNEMEILSRAKEGERNDQLNRSAFNLFQLVGPGRLDAQIVSDALCAAGLALGLPEAEVAATVHSARNAAVSRPIVERPKAQEVDNVDFDLLPEPQPDADTWLPRDLLPYYDGEVDQEVPNVGIVRSDGIATLYAGKEHAIIGEMESGKSWFALACAMAEMEKGNHVVYIHFEESNPQGTVTRLRDMGVTREMIELFHFVGPEHNGSLEAVSRLVAIGPTLVILDGVNEAMGMHRWKINDPDGYADFRRALIKPFTAINAATLALDHVVKDAANRGRTALGSIHKVNALSGVALSIENTEPFGRGRVGKSSVYVIKDRPGFLRQHGNQEKLAGKTYIGSLIGESNDLGEFKGISMMLKLMMPKPSTVEVVETVGTANDIEVMRAIKAILDRRSEDVCIMGDLYAEVALRQSEVRSSVANLERAGLLILGQKGTARTVRILGQKEDDFDQR